jgi:hypothetical protein
MTPLGPIQHPPVSLNEFNDLTYFTWYPLTLRRLRSITNKNAHRFTSHGIVPHTGTELFSGRPLEQLSRLPMWQLDGSRPCHFRFEFRRCSSCVTISTVGVVIGGASVNTGRPPATIDSGLVVPHPAPWAPDPRGAEADTATSVRHERQQRKAPRVARKAPSGPAPVVAIRCLLIDASYVATCTLTSGRQLVYVSSRRYSNSRARGRSSIRLGARLPVRMPSCAHSIRTGPM